MAQKLVTTQTPGVYKRGDRYVVVWRHRGKQHKSFHRTYAEAREAKGQRQSGDSRPSAKQPFGDYALAWIEGYQGRTSKGLDEGTRSSYLRALELHAIPFFDGYRINEIEPPDMRKYVAHLQSIGLSVGTVRRYVAPVKAMFATAYEDGDLPANPTYRLRITGRRDAQDEPVERAKAMTRAELAAVLAAVDEQWRLLFEVLAYTGLRISEALGLDWEDLEFGDRPRLRVRRQFYRGTIKPHAKTNAGTRSVPLSPGLARKLWAARPPKATGPMFTTASGERHQDYNVRQQALDPVRRGKILKRRRGPDMVVPARVPDVEWIGFHTFRHTCASMLLESGKNIRQVSAWLGHEDPAFTLRTYTHLMDDGLGDAALFDDLIIRNERGEDEEGNNWATEDPQTTANASLAATAESTA